MAFNSINRQFTLSQFAAWLASLPRQTWVRGSTYHNTFKPTEAEWRGKATMDGMQAHYTSLGWTSGPHLFLVLHCPNPTDAGIWVMTPPLYPGTHAGVCNADHFGIEVVGDFNATPPSAAQQQLLIDTLAALHRWAGIGPTLDAHRDCMPGRTCPGDAFYALKPQLQVRLAAALPSADPLRARKLIGPPDNRTIYASVGASDFYFKRGGVALFGYPLKDEYRDQEATILTCERAVIKSSDIFGVELALLSEAKSRGWLP